VENVEGQEATNKSWLMGHRTFGVWRATPGRIHGVDALVVTAEVALVVGAFATNSMK